MELKIVRGEELDVKGWDDFVRGHPEGNIFQSPMMSEIFKHVPGYEPVVYGALEGNQLKGILAGVLQKESKGYFSDLTARMIVWGGPVIDQSSVNPVKVADLLINTLVNRIKRRSVYIEIRNLSEQRFKESFEKEGFHYIPYLNSLLIPDNRSIELILSGMAYNRRREIRISKEAGATYREAVTLEEVHGFYAVLIDLYRNRVKVPLAGVGLFEEIFRSEAGKIFVVSHEGKIIGGTACLIFDKRVLYTFYYCGLKDHHPRVYPSHLAVMAAIEYAVEHGIKIVDLMGAGRPDKDYGVRDYKLRFGCEFPEYGRFLRINRPLIYALGKAWIRASQKMTKL